MGSKQKVTLCVVLTDFRLVLEDEQVDAGKHQVSRQLRAGGSKGQDQDNALLHSEFKRLETCSLTSFEPRSPKAAAADRKS